MLLPWFLFVLVPSLAVAAQPSDLAARASKKFHLIDSRQAKPGSVIFFTATELNAWARESLPTRVNGVREPRIALGAGTATVSALVDFVKLRAGEGHETNAALAKLIEGERRLQVTARLESGAGRATVHLARTEIGGVTITGTVLDFLVNTIFRPMFPEAHINEPFDLGGNIERIEIRPRGVSVAIKKQLRKRRD